MNGKRGVSAVRLRLGFTLMAAADNRSVLEPPPTDSDVARKVREQGNRLIEELWIAAPAEGEKVGPIEAKALARAQASADSDGRERELQDRPDESFAISMEPGAAAAYLDFCTLTWPIQKRPSWRT